MKWGAEKKKNSCLGHELAVHCDFSRRRHSSRFCMVIGFPEVQELTVTQNHYCREGRRIIMSLQLRGGRNAIIRVFE